MDGDEALWFLLVTDSYCRNPSKATIFYERNKAFYDHLSQLIPRAAAAEPPSTAAAGPDLVTELKYVHSVWNRSIITSAHLRHLAPQVVECDNGFTCMFKTPQDFSNVILIAGWKNSSSTNLSRQVVERRMHTAHAVIKFLYGPGYSLWLGMERRTSEWLKISLLLNKWVQLYNEEQAYLLESVEHVERADNVLKADCVSVFTKAEKTLNEGLGYNAQDYKHCILSAGPKVMHSYSPSAYTCIPPQMMMLAVLTALALFPNKPECEEETPPCDEPNSLDIHPPSTTSESEINLLRSETGSSSESSHSLSNGLQDVSTDSENKTTPITPPSSNSCERSETTTTLSTSLDPADLLRDMLDAHQRSPSQLQLIVKKEKFAVLRVYIHVHGSADNFRYMPADLYIFHVTSNINLILLVECGRLRNLTPALKPIEVLHNLMIQCLQPGAVRLKTSSLRLVLDSIRDMRSWAQRHSTPDVVERITLGRSTWLNRQEVLKRFCQNKPGRDGCAFEITSLDDVVIILLQMIDHFKDIFNQLYLKSLRTLDQVACDSLEKLCRKKCLKKLMHHVTYLNMKVKFNSMIPLNMTSRCPGLVHYIYINRSAGLHSVRCPSLHVVNNDTSTSAQILPHMKSMLWRILPEIYGNVAKGFTSQTIQANDFMIMYELHVHNEIFVRHEANLTIPTASKATSGTSPQSMSIGDFTGDFYQRLLANLPETRQTGTAVIELITVHWAVVPRASIKWQRRVLFDELHYRHGSGKPQKI